ncbi:hypothetical protein BDP27DRAFT_1447734 [Rhodocollybia butyracea]|uniref:Uncharacterized protein n=1 Tax=Rhodocollybia butyracea TaxID=206335 RepID=A0A9P5PVI6_9AGAR|nr:hypothetical protein BDP27DRAFT_1447734 [Rhodocollybia butyracea]
MRFFSIVLLVLHVSVVLAIPFPVKPDQVTNVTPRSFFNPKPKPKPIPIPKPMPKPEGYRVQGEWEGGSDKIPPTDKAFKALSKFLYILKNGHNPRTPQILVPQLNNYYSDPAFDNGAQFSFMIEDNTGKKRRRVVGAVRITNAEGAVSGYISAATRRAAPAAPALAKLDNDRLVKANGLSPKDEQLLEIFISCLEFRDKV